jgi:hypothetical protein
LGLSLIASDLISELDLTAKLDFWDVWEQPRGPKEQNSIICASIYSFSYLIL